MRIGKDEAMERNEHGQNILTRLFREGWSVVSTGSVLALSRGKEKREYTFKRGYLTRCI